MDMNSIIMHILQGGGAGGAGGAGMPPGGMPFGGQAGGAMPPAPGGLGGPQTGAAPGLPYPRPGTMMGPQGASGLDAAGILAALGGQSGAMGQLGGGMGMPMGGGFGMNRFTPPQAPRQSEIGDIIRQHFNRMVTPPSQAALSFTRADRGRFGNISRGYGRR